jgi:flagellar biogenesis protein FliO
MFRFLLSALFASAAHRPSGALHARGKPRRDLLSALLSVALGPAFCLLALGATVPGVAQGSNPPASDQNAAAGSFFALPFETPAHPSTPTTGTVVTPTAKTAKATPKPPKLASTHAHAVTSQQTRSTPHKPTSDAKSGKSPHSDAAWRKAWLQKYQTQQAKSAHVAAQKRAQAAARLKALPGTQKTTHAALLPAQAVATYTTMAGPPLPAAAAHTKVTTKPAAGSLFTQTRPDSFGASSASGGSAASANRTQDNPLAALGDAWKMLIYLVPMLLLTLGALRLLRRFYERTGRLPGPLQSAALTTGNGRGSLATRPSGGGLVNALVGSFHLNNMRQHGGSSIRLVESVPVGSANLHLIEVRGRLLLIGATGTGVSLLTEFQEPDALETNDFRALLQAAAVDMDSLDMAQPDLPATAMVGSLEEAMRDTRDAVARRVRRLHTVQEVEDAGA